MSVIYCGRLPGGMTLDVDNKFKRTYQVTYLVITNDADDGPLTVDQGALAASPDALPAMWDNYPFDGGDPFVVLNRRSTKRAGKDEKGYHWHVTCTWSQPEPGTTQDEAEVENPLNRPARYHLEWANYTKIVEKDNNGDPVVNSAGDPFNPPITYDDARPVLVVEKNMWPLQDIIDMSVEYKNAVNDDTFMGAAARTVKMESIVSGQIMEENGVEFYRVTWRMQFNDETWDFALVDRGTQVLEEQDLDGTGPGTAVGMVKVYPRVKSGDKVGEYLDIVNLNADGTQRDETLPALYIDPAFRVYPEKDFSALTTIWAA